MLLLRKLIFLILYNLCLLLDETFGATYCPVWEYGKDCKGSEKWIDNFPTCGEEYQSPIFLDLPRIKKYEILKKTIVLNNYKNLSTKYLINNGHTVEMQLSDEDYRSKPPYAEDNTFGKFYLAQISFHWGINNKEGCEHHIKDKNNCVLEMQIIHTSTKNFKKKQPFLLGLSVLFQVGEKMEENAAFKHIFSTLKSMTERKYHLINKPMEISEAFSLDSAFPKPTPPSYAAYFYNGSLTEPPCTNTMYWYIFANNITITSEQVELFRKFCSKTRTCNPIKCNIRAIQKSMSRSVHEASIEVKT